MHHRHPLDSPAQLLLAAHASQMRAVPTHSEELLWSRLRGNQLGVTFRRQVPIGGRFIADFFAREARLVVEVDGGYHKLRHAVDQRRDRQLARIGYRVLHVDAELVERNVTAAVADVRAALVT